jgi:tetratricopeptide (TPR) repeat protein
VHYHLGLAYCHAQRYQEALPHLTQALSFDPNKAATLFYLGYSHYQLKQYQQALPFFEQAMVVESDLAPSAQYYRGLTLYALAQYAQAQAAFEAVVAAVPSSTIGVDAQRYVEVLTQRTRNERLLQVQGVVSLQYDDNVTIGDDEIISGEGDGRTVFALVGRVLPVRTEQWRLGIEGDLFQTLHFDLDEFNIQSYTGRAFAHWQRDQVMLHIATDYTYSTLDNKRFSEALTVYPRATIRETDQTWSIVSVRYQRSNYFNQFIVPGEEDVRDRDGWSVSPGLMQYWAFNRQRSYMRFGYEFEASRNDGSDWDYNSHRLAVGLYTPLWWGINLDLEGAYRRRDYLHVNSFDSAPLGVLTATDHDKRTDDRFTASVVLSRAFGRHMILSAGYAHTSNLSNIDFFEYDRNIWTVAFTGRL